MTKNCNFANGMDFKHDLTKLKRKTSFLKVWFEVHLQLDRPWTTLSTFFLLYLWVGIMCATDAKEVPSVVCDGRCCCCWFWFVMRWLHQQIAMTWYIETTKAAEPMAMSRMTRLFDKRSPWPSLSPMDQVIPERRNGCNDLNWALRRWQI